MASSMPAQRLLAVVALFVALCIGSPLGAQTTPDTKTAGKVLRLVKDANDEFDRGEFDDALQLYQEAYDLYPDAVLLYRIGLSADKSGSLRRAVQAYEAFVAAAKSDNATAEQVTARIAELKAIIPPRLTLTSVPAGADVYLGDLESRSLGQTPGDFDLPAGPVDLLVRLDGYKLVKHSVDLSNGESASADVQLEQLVGLEQPDLIKKPDDTSGGGGLGLGGWGWITTGVGVAALGTGVTFAILSSSATEEVNTYDKRAPGASPAGLQALKDKANSRHSTSVALLVGGGVVTAVGVSLIVVDALMDDGESAGLAPAVGVHQGGAWVGFTGRF